MSRPGFVFDVTTEEGRQSWVCRNCERPVDGADVAAARRHLRDHHDLTDDSGWKTTRFERSSSAAAVCFWPPEAV